MQLGSLRLAGRVILSPMEAVSDCAFRRLCHQQGAALTWTEMVRASAVAKNNLATLELIDCFDADVPTGLQLLVRGADDLTRCLTKLEAFASGQDQKLKEVPRADGGVDLVPRDFSHFHNLCAVDINLGCPSPDVIQLGAGPALLRRSRRLREIFDALVKWRDNNSLKGIQAVGCKIRLGLSQREQASGVYMEVAAAASAAGLDYICVHARHAGQRSRDPPAWSCIKEVVAASNIPVIGNGDVFTDKDAANMLQQTGCAGIMVARAAIRNPWALNHFHRVCEANGADSSLTGSATAVAFHKASWPSLSQLQVAEREYLDRVAAIGTKEKFVKFHLSNFERMRSSIEKNDYSLKVYTPRTNHI